MSNLKVGDPAPDFQSTDQDGNPVSLKDFRGKKLILYFYPKDGTPGCTAEACNLRDNYQILRDKGFFILGVSADDERSHQKFVARNVLPFPLIPDKAKTILKNYGMLGMKKLYGKEFEGILRTTVVISETGIITHIINKVDTINHASQILRVTGIL